MAYYTALHDEEAREVLGYFVQLAKMDVDTRDVFGRTPFEVLLKNSGYSSESLHWTLKTAQMLYQLGSKDINATAYGGNTVLHLTVWSTPSQWPTQLAQWVEAGVKDVPNEQGETALDMVEHTMKRIAKDNRLYTSVFESGVPSEYKKARKVLRNTPQEKQRQAQRRKATKELFLQTLQNISLTDK